MNRPYFKYYWEGAADDGGALAFYGLQVVTVKNGTIVPGGDSDVSADMLRAEGIETPATPTYEDWASQVRSKKRCARCWAALKGATDLEHHNRTNHGGAVMVQIGVRP